MPRPFLLIGLGGFGKWVVTAFKTKILDTYGGKPSDIDWLSFDLVGQEAPPVQYKRFEMGKLKEEALDFSPTSPEFFQFGGDFNQIIENIKTGREDDRFSRRLTKDDADLFITSLEAGVPAAERRHASLIQFVLDVERIKRIITQRLRPNMMIFLANSLAGGTGCGIFIDFLLLLRKLIQPFKGTIISVLLLPYGFSKVKQNEDMNPLYANCFAAFREMMRLFCPEGNVMVTYSLADLELQNIKKAGDVISDLIYIIDGSRIAKYEGSEIEHYRGIVPVIANFIEISFLALKTEENKFSKAGKVTTQTSFDNAKTHTTNNLKTPKAKENPYNSFSFASFGSYRMIFDSQAIKTEFSQRIAFKLFDQFLSASWIPDPEFYVKQYTLNDTESTKFDRMIIHDCVTKLHQLQNFATYRSLKSRLEHDIKFPEFDFGSIKPTGKLSETKNKIDNRESFTFGEENDQLTGKGIRSSFYAVYNHYLKYYSSEFKKCIQKKLLSILNDYEKGTDNYLKGSLNSALTFIMALKNWYILFLKGFPEQSIKSKFTIACENADNVEGEYNDWNIRVENFYKIYERKGRGLLSDKRKEYISLRSKLIELRSRNLLRDLIIKIASENLAYLEKVQQELNNWIYTFEQCKKTMQKALDDLLVARNARKQIVCDEYLTNSQDETESEFFELITNYNATKWAKIENSTDERDVRLKEIIHKIPHKPWSEYLRGFEFKFNLPDERGIAQSVRYLPGELYCTVDAGMPDFPIREEWDRDEYIKTWNYKLVEHYLIAHKLNDIDNISAFEILMLRQDDPREIFQKLKNNSEIMLFRDQNKIKELQDEGYPALRPELHYFITSYFGYKTDQPRLKSWVETLKNEMNSLPQEQISEVDIKEKCNEVVFSTAFYGIPAPAMVHLANCETVYLDRMERRLPPPLHIFIGEKMAYNYEKEISKKLRIGYERLHPKIVSLLEREETLRSFLLAKIFGLIKEGQDYNSKRHRYEKYIDIGGYKFPYDSDESDIIFDLLYPPSGKETEFKNIIDDIGNQLNKKLHELKKTTIEDIKRKKIKEIKELIHRKEDPLTKKQKDLYKIWLIMLEQNII